MTTPQINMGKQLHSIRCELTATPSGTDLISVPRKAFIYDILIDNKTNLPRDFYGDNKVSVGITANKEFVAKATDISKAGVTRMELGPGAGYQDQDITLKLFWNYTGKGQPCCGPLLVLILFDLS